MAKQLWVSVVLVLAGVSAASAADMPLKAAKAPLLTAPVSAYNWTGIYGGIEGGWGWGTARQTDPLPFSSGNYAVNGGLIGATLGYNQQFNNWVAGLEVDFGVANIRGSTNGLAGGFGGCGGNPPSCSSQLQTLGTFRGRLGIPWWNVLPYFTGGLAWGFHAGQEGDTPINGAVGDGGVTRVGWTIGGGIEAFLGGNWTAKAEYLYVDFGNRGVFTDNLGGVPPLLLTESISLRVNIFRVGLNYRLSPGL